MVCPKRIIPIIILAGGIFFSSRLVLAATIPDNLKEPTAKNEQKEATSPSSDIKTSTSSANPSTNFQAVSTANMLYNRLVAASSRLELIFNRITKRTEKIYANFARGKNDAKAKKLNAQYDSLKNQIDKLKIENGKTQESYKAFLTEPDNSHYQLFRKQVVAEDTLLKQVLEAEKNILATLENLTPASASVTPKVTSKVASPTAVKK